MRKLFLFVSGLVFSVSVMAEPLISREGGEIIFNPSAVVEPLEGNIIKIVCCLVPLFILYFLSRHSTRIMRYIRVNLFKESEMHIVGMTKDGKPISAVYLREGKYLRNVETGRTIGQDKKFYRYNRVKAK